VSVQWNAYHLGDSQVAVPIDVAKVMTYPEKVTKTNIDLMRQLVPGMSEKTDKATVFEFSARYIHFLKNFVGTHHDKVSQLKWKSKKDLLRGLLSDCIA